MTVFDRDPPFCVYCGCRLHADGRIGGRFYFSIDHIEPRSLGGTDDPMNLVLSCRPCNSGRGNRTILSFLAELSLLNSGSLLQSPGMPNE